MKSNLNRRDLFTLPVLVLALGILAVMSINNGIDFFHSDDWAAYLNEAIAISEGRQVEQDRLNVFMHPSPLTFLDEDEHSLTYVWGYPLILSVIHRFVGWDTWTYSSLIFYKLPGVCALAALGGILFLFYRRHFSYFPSLFLSLLFCLSPQFFPEVNIISPELPFLFFFVLALWLIEVILEQSRLTVRLSLMIGLGFVFWCACITRLNGPALIVFTAIAHFIGILRNPPNRKYLILELLPYLVFVGLLQLSYAILPAPTSNTSDIGKVDFATICHNIRIYCDQFHQWFGSIFSHSSEDLFHANFTGIVMLIFMFWGIFKKGIYENLHLTLLILFTFMTVCLLNYTQGLRYIFSILPYALLFSAYGIETLYISFCSHCDEVLHRISRRAFILVGLVVTSFVIIPNAQYAINCFATRGDELPLHTPYSTQSIDLYHYIQAETDEDSIIAYYKPRALYLNTGRISFKPQLSEDLVSKDLENSFLPYQTRYVPLITADYILIYSDVFDDEYNRILIELGDSARLELVYQNSIYRFFKVIQL